MLKAALPARYNRDPNRVRAGDPYLKEKAMKFRKAAFWTLSIPMSAFLSGCLDPGQLPVTGETKSYASVASQESPVDLCAGCGSIPAFTSKWDPDEPWGWALDATVPINGGYTVRFIYYDWNTLTTKVTTRTGGLVDIDLTNETTLFGVNSYGHIFVNTEPHNVNSAWTYLKTNFSAARIVAGPGGVYALGKTNVSGGHPIYRWLGSTAWQQMPGGLMDMDIDINGDLWGVNDKGLVFLSRGIDYNQAWVRYDPYGAVPPFVEITCGNRKVFALDSYGRIWKKTDTSWQQFSGTGYKSIHVSPAGYLYAGTIYNHIHTWQVN